MIKDDHRSVQGKVLQLFAEVVGERSRRIDGATVAVQTQNAISKALATEYEKKKAIEIAFHMADWNWDSAFITALHLFPERFTRSEIRAGMRQFLAHAPNHIVAACGLAEYEARDIWEELRKKNETPTSED